MWIKDTYSTCICKIPLFIRIVSGFLFFVALKLVHILIKINFERVLQKMIEGIIVV